MATVNDVAQRAGVSDTIVCAVLSPSTAKVRCSSETRRRVIQAAQELGYRRHPFYTAMRTGRTHIIGLYMADASKLLNHPHAAYGLSVVQAALAERGYSPLIAALDNPRICDFRLMDGLMVLDCRRGEESLIATAAQAVPTFGWLGTPYDRVDGVYSPPDSLCDQVRAGNHEIAANYLYDLGHRRIALIEPSGGALHPARSVFQRTADARGAAVELDEVYDRLMSRVYSNTMAFLDREELPTAFYALDDEVAQRIAEKLRWKGLAVPADVSIFSRQTDVPDPVAHTSVTGIFTDWPAVWRGLVHQYLDVIEGKRRVEQIDVSAPAQRVVERTTCAPPLAQRSGNADGASHETP